MGKVKEAHMKTFMQVMVVAVSCALCGEIVWYEWRQRIRRPAISKTVVADQNSAVSAARQGESEDDAPSQFQYRKMLDKKVGEVITAAAGGDGGDAAAVVQMLPAAALPLLVERLDRKDLRL